MWAVPVVVALSVTVEVALKTVALPSAMMVWPSRLLVVLTVKVSMLVVVAFKVVTRKSVKLANWPNTEVVATVRP